MATLRAQLEQALRGLEAAGSSVSERDQRIAELEAAAAGAEVRS